MTQLLWNVNPLEGTLTFHKWLIPWQKTLIEIPTRKSLLVVTPVPSTWDSRIYSWQLSICKKVEGRVLLMTSEEGRRRGSRVFALLVVFWKGSGSLSRNGFKYAFERSSVAVESRRPDTRRLYLNPDLPYCITIWALHRRRRVPRTAVPTADCRVGVPLRGSLSPRRARPLFPFPVPHPPCGPPPSQIDSADLDLQTTKNWGQNDHSSLVTVYEFVDVNWR